MRGRLSAQQIPVQDWSWIDLAEDLPWAADLAALCSFSRRLYATAADLRPLVLYLRADIEQGVQRAARQRGAKWLARHQVGFTNRADVATAVADVADFYRTRERRLRGALTAGGWPVTDIQADSTAAEVLARSLEVLLPT